MYFTMERQLPKGMLSPRDYRTSGRDELLRIWGRAVSRFSLAAGPDEQELIPTAQSSSPFGTKIAAFGSRPLPPLESFCSSTR